MTSKLKPSGNKLGKALEITSGGNPNEYAVKGSIHITLERDIPRPTRGGGVDRGERCIAPWSVRFTCFCLILFVVNSSELLGAFGFHKGIHGVDQPGATYFEEFFVVVHLP